VKSVSSREKTLTKGANDMDIVTVGAKRGTPLDEENNSSNAS